MGPSITLKIVLSILVGPNVRQEQEQGSFVATQ